MRPVDKGPAPRVFTAYQQAIEPLEERLGPYCAYCEMRINVGLEVEHVVPKSMDKTLELAWSNFLPACKCCNTVKSKKPVSISHYVWPHLDNTAAVFFYDLNKDGHPTVVAGLSVAIQVHAQNLIKLVGLDRHPTYSPANDKPRRRDVRWRYRRDAVLRAGVVRGLIMLRPDDDSREFGKLAAVGFGFWSIWMATFTNDTKMRRLLIAAFPNTALQYFDPATTAVLPIG